LRWKTGSGAGRNRTMGARTRPAVRGRHVHIPDARIEYEDRDGRSRHEDIEIVTGHYRGAHAGAVARSGFSCYRAVGGMFGGCASTGRRGGSRHPRLAEELLG
jgi:hypothetical protein